MGAAGVNIDVETEFGGALEEAIGGELFGAHSFRVAESPEADALDAGGLHQLAQTGWRVGVVQVAQTGRGEAIGVFVDPVFDLGGGRDGGAVQFDQNRAVDAAGVHVGQ